MYFISIVVRTAMIKIVIVSLFHNLCNVYQLQDPIWIKIKVWVANQEKGQDVCIISVRVQHRLGPSILSSVLCC